MTSFILFAALSPHFALAVPNCRALFENDDILKEKIFLNEMRKTGWEPLIGQGPMGKWSIDGPESAFYLRELIDIMKAAEPGKVASINGYLENRKENGLSTHVLDLFGSGFFVRPSEYDPMGVDVSSVTGMRYDPFDLSLLPANYPANRLPTEILGDIFQPRTWKKLDQSMKARGIPKMDFIAMRPVGAWDQSAFSHSVQGNAAAISFILLNVVQRLNNDGKFYFTLNFPRAFGGAITDTPEFINLVHEIEKTTPFRLVLKARTNISGETRGLDGALLPKRIP